MKLTYLINSMISKAFGKVSYQKYKFGVLKLKDNGES